MSGHPSFRDLDRSALGEAMPEVIRHAEHCEGCRAHLERLRSNVALPPLRMPSPVEARVSHIRAPAWLRWLGMVGVPAAATASLLIWIQSSAPPDPPADAPLPLPLVASKGGPSVAIYLLRGESLSLWDGVSAVEPGDRIRIRVSPAGFRHLMVATRAEGSDHWTSLFQGEVGDEAEFVVPGAWEVDDASEAEQLLVALDPAPTPLERAAWRKELKLPKVRSP